MNVDVAVTSLAAARPFYEAVIGRPADLDPPNMAEWILHREPEIAVRVVETDSRDAGTTRVGIGVVDVEGERVRLSALLADVPDVARKPGVIAKLKLVDPDGNAVTLWQDLLTRAAG